jgi:hypothetical protein
LRQRQPVRSGDSWPTSTAATWPAPIGVIWAAWPASLTRNPSDATGAAPRLGSGCCTPMPVWRPKAQLCWKRPSTACAATPARCGHRTVPGGRPRPASRPAQTGWLIPWFIPQPSPARRTSMNIGCTGFGFRSASPSPTGASPINGSPRNCSCVIRPPHKSQPSCGAAVQDFRDNTPIQMTTSAAPSHVPHGNLLPALFLGAIFSSTTLAHPMHLARDRAARPALCGTLMPKPSLRQAPRASPACAQTALANDNRGPNADAFRCRPSPGTRRSPHARAPDSDIQSCIPLHA